eukprot:scaffold1617_cov99-Skeletonema_dohrnii-CCMP3373.AAC.2
MGREAPIFYTVHTQVEDAFSTSASSRIQNKYSLLRRKMCQDQVIVMTVDRMGFNKEFIRST